MSSVTLTGCSKQGPPKRALLPVVSEGSAAALVAAAALAAPVVVAVTVVPALVAVVAVVVLAARGLDLDLAVHDLARRCVPGPRDREGVAGPAVGDVDAERLRRAPVDPVR